MELEVIVLKPICDDCSAMMDRPTFVERVLDPSKKSEVVPLFPLETVPERLRMYERSTALSPFVSLPEAPLRLVRRSLLQVWAAHGHQERR
jgi:hypothetical protein